MGIANTEQAEHWASVAPAWLQIEDHLERMAGDPGREAMDRLGVGPGQRVLDFGCDAGPTTVELARRVDGELLDYARGALRMGAARDALKEADEATEARAFESVAAALEEAWLPPWRRRCTTDSYG